MQEQTNEANLGSMIARRSNNRIDLSSMKRSHQQKEVVLRLDIENPVALSNSSSCSIRVEEQSDIAFGFSSTQALLENYSNFKRSSAPSRFMFYEKGRWVDFCPEVFEILRLGFLEGRPMVEVEIKGGRFLFDFLRMAQLNLITGNQRSIAWIDANGRCFFPKLSVDEEIDTMAPVATSPKIGKRKRHQLELVSADQVSDENSSSSDQLDTAKRCRVRSSFPPILERTKWPNVKRLDDGDENYSLIKMVFLSGLKKIDPDTTITAIYRCLHMGPSGGARLEVFRKQMEMTKVARGTSNVRLAWHGTSAKGVAGIVAHGFGLPNKLCGFGSYGVGIYLSPPYSPQTSALVSEADNDGERHVVLCRVILGNVEKIEAGSRQFHPSSEEFDTGVDDLRNPKWYIVWSTHMNRYILPECIVSYKSSRRPEDPEGLFRGSSVLRRIPASSMSFTRLFSEMKSSLSTITIKELEDLYNLYKVGKVAKDVFIKQLRLHVGDEILLSAVQKVQDSTL